jgi:hypothetical protein
MKWQSKTTKIEKQGTACVHSVRVDTFRFFGGLQLGNPIGILSAIVTIATNALLHQRRPTLLCDSRSINTLPEPRNLVCFHVLFYSSSSSSSPSSSPSAPPLPRNRSIHFLVSATLKLFLPKLKKLNTICTLSLEWAKWAPAARFDVPSWAWIR